MALDMYMQITAPDIKGHASNQVTGGLFGINSLSFGGVTPVSGKTTMTQITATLGYDSVTDLFVAMAGAHTHTVVFTMYQSVSPKTSIQTITLDDALLTMIQESMASDDDKPNLEISWAFEKITIKETDTPTQFTFGGLTG
jgi:type VI protein secretion system component Hcp